MTYAEKITWIMLMAFLFSGCASAGKSASNAVLEHQRKIAELEATIGRIDNIMSDAANGLREITSRSANMEAEIDGIIREFDDYQQRVEHLLREYNALRNESTSVLQNRDGASVSPDNTNTY